MHPYYFKYKLFMIFCCKVYVKATLSWIFRIIALCIVVKEKLSSSTEKQYLYKIQALNLCLFYKALIFSLEYMITLV